MILSCSNIEKAFDGNVILSKCTFIANEHEKLAIVGVNGAGKSTLLKIIMGEIPADNGNRTSIRIVIRQIFSAPAPPEG